MDYIVWVPFCVTIYLGASAAFGLLFSPIAAFDCGRAAGSRGLGARKYAVAGAVYSVLFLLPWIYLRSQLRNKPLTDCTIAGGYALIYGLWVLGPVTSVIGMVTAGNESNRYIDLSIVLLVMVAVVAVSLLHQIVSYAAIRPTRIRNSDVGSKSLIPSLANIMPFVYTYITLLVYLLVIVRGSQ